MKSETWPYKVAAVYPDAAAADAAVTALGVSDTDDVRISRLAPGDGNTDRAIEPRPDETRDTVTRQTFAGSAAGAALAGAATVVAPTLFVSAPLIGPLIVLGYGAMVGGMAGAIRGLKLQETVLTGLVKDALKAGYHVVIVNAANEAAHHRMQAVVNDTMPDNIACRTG